MFFMYCEKYDRIVGFYELFERLFDRFFNLFRESVVFFVEGKMFEIGVGIGKIFRYYF